MNKYVIPKQGIYNITGYVNGHYYSNQVYYLKDFEVSLVDIDSINYISDGFIISKNIKFDNSGQIQARKGVESFYKEPVILSNERGFTYNYPEGSETYNEEIHQHKFTKTTSFSGQIWSTCECGQKEEDL